MVHLKGRVISLKVRTLFRIFISSSIIIVTFLLYQRWTSAPNSGRQSHTFSRHNLDFQRDIQTNGRSKDAKSIHGLPNLAKYIHLDLKGAPPIPTKFYENFFRFLEKLQMGIKGILLEYEDMLPLDGSLANISHRNAYSKSDISLIQEAAKRHKLEIIPLIQTFGHFEWILKLEKYQFYRDDLNVPTVISPCVNATYTLLEDLLQQALDMHPDSNIIHIGCDEVTLKYSNPACVNEYIRASDMYINHVRRVVDIVRRIRPGIRILIWDDILRSDHFIQERYMLARVKGLVEPVSWNYFPTFDEHYKSSPAWKIYPKYFRNRWIASAFKGGLHRFSMLTNTTHHVSNNRYWLEFISSSFFQQNSFAAIILTGWSRFDHFMPICDLLPTAYPSLVYSLHVLNTNQYITDESTTTCESLLKSVDKDSRLCKPLPGLSIWSGISSLSKILSTIQNRLKILNTIAPKYNRDHLFVRRHELESRLQQLKVLQIRLLTSKIQLRHRFMELYSEDVISEWFDLYVTPVESEVNKTSADFLTALNKTTWERRPIS